MARKQKHGTAILTCQNHRDLRWTHTKYVLEGPSPYMGRGRLMFEGKVNGLPACPVDVYSESSLAQRPAEFQEWYRSSYQPECDCPVHDLEFVGWVDDLAVVAA